MGEHLQRPLGGRETKYKKLTGIQGNTPAAGGFSTGTFIDFQTRHRNLNFCLLRQFTIFMLAEHQ